MDKRRGRSLPDAMLLKPLAFNLEEALQVENIYRPNLASVSSADYKPGGVTLSSRDGAVKNLRFLRIWLDLPHNVFFTAVSYLDMFLSRMKVQEKFLKCLTLSCLYLAADTENSKINVDNLVKISQSKCTSRDVVRMAIIVKEKTKNPEGSKATTPSDFLKIYLEILKFFTNQWEHIISRDMFQIRENMLILLEVLLSDSSTAYFRSSALALIIFQMEVEKIMAKGLPNKSLYFLGEVLQFLSIVREIQLKCKIRNVELKNCYIQIAKVLKQYESEKNTKSHQKMTWNFSKSTIQTCKRPGYYSNFQTIKE
ncbi:cyclin G [Sitophilus oryzae]|uniref:Cyclin G n=1 Tax=Sitophilus oryzae TaxID=7048 RepID=A0A6J2XAN1_SITOR|nr:cyclin G [Sitophilus oryzae]